MKDYIIQIGLEEYYIDMIPFDFEKARGFVDEVLNNYSEVKSGLEKSVEKMVELSKKNIACVIKQNMRK